MTTSPIAPNAVDPSGLEQLRRSAARNDPAALSEAAVQFEALFIGMMLDSARKASFGGGLFDGPQTQQYMELMDRQVALEMARHGGLGFGKLLMQQLTPGAQGRPNGGLAPASAAQPAAAPVTAVPATGVDAPQASTAQPAAAADPAAALAADPAAFPGGETAAAPSAADAFVAKLLPEAQAAAAALGVEPRVLLAQAALETGWGKATPQRSDGAPANNLFGIKAGAAWLGARTAQWTLEQQNGVTERRRAEFRAYPSTSASFADYVDLISNTPRYADALASAGNPESYARAVSAAGYATDPAYADKWLSIYHGDRLDAALRRAGGTGSSVSATAALDALGDLEP
ncbi:MAG TPA: flagellar assembly peptidoglycan hydrolase FlgJ [Gammaproteobacteria bacterium]|nr:flagellar assembly peptidoglycan hydrolase FlgJ [Gammaproteobacteria bacterium]